VIDHLTRREIQAPLANVLLRAFAREMGTEKALEVATAAIQEDAAAGGHTLAMQMGGNGLREMARVVQEVWAQGGALEIDFQERSDTELRFQVTRCRYAELYQSLWMRDLGYCLSCSRDPAFGRGFNPCMTLQRMRTIMEGADSCDFRFRIE
jgi:L-2-amino-thiazoline-4-carboxylic acid hydrolase